MIVTVPSAATRIKAAGRNAGAGGCGDCAKTFGRSSECRANRTPPPAMAETRKNARRSRSVVLTGPPFEADFCPGEGARPSRGHCNAEWNRVKRVRLRARGGEVSQDVESGPHRLPPVSREQELSCQRACRRRELNRHSQGALRAGRPLRIASTLQRK